MTDALGLGHQFGRLKPWSQTQAQAVGEAAFSVVRRLDRQNGHLSASFRETDAETAGNEILAALVAQGEKEP